MKRLLHIAVVSALLALVARGGAHAQAPLSLDPTFQTGLSTWYVSGLLPLANGKVVASGQMRYEGEFLFRALMRFEADGTLDESFYQSGLGGGRITPWRGDTFYVATSQTVRRILPTGYRDQSFIEMNTSPLFSSLQGGDYHVYPDGSIVMSGVHSLYDTARGFVGLYNLIWFTNTGHLDTTKTHRTGNGAIYEIEQQPDGKFLCSGTGTVYDGQPVRNIFRIHPDGALDTTFDSHMTWGDADAFLPLPDGRAYMVGICRREGAPDDTIRVARLMPDGSLDPTFDPQLNFSVGELPNALSLGAVVGHIHPWLDGDILLTGLFQYVNGQVRRGICVLDHTGALQPEFDGCGVSTFDFQGTLTGSIQSIARTPDNMLYVYGAYHGYTDGTTNDPDQRFITRLYGPDMTTGSSRKADPIEHVMIVPNPNMGTFTLRMHAISGRTQVSVLDASGRIAHTTVLGSGLDQYELNMDLEPGPYTIVLLSEQGDKQVARLVIE